MQEDFERVPRDEFLHHVAGVLILGRDHLDATEALGDGEDLLECAHLERSLDDPCAELVEGETDPLALQLLADHGQTVTSDREQLLNMLTLHR